MTPAWCLSKSWDDVLGEGLHLAHFLVERHEALVEEPAEPFQLAFVPDAVQRLNLALHLVGRAGERVLDLAHTLKGPLRRRQRRVGVERVLGRIFLGPERFPEPEATEIVIEAGLVGASEQLDGFGFSAAEMDGAEGTDALAQVKLAPVLSSDVAIGSA